MPPFAGPSVAQAKDKHLILILLLGLIHAVGQIFFRIAPGSLRMAVRHVIRLSESIESYRLQDLNAWKKLIFVSGQDT